MFNTTINQINCKSEDIIVYTTDDAYKLTTAGLVKPYYATVTIYILKQSYLHKLQYYRAQNV